MDKKKARIIKQVFEIYAQNNSYLEDIANFLARNGILRRSRKVWHKDRVKYLLSNPFYYGHFHYAKEIHEGKHDSIISKKLFDKVQEVLKQKGKPRHKKEIEPQIFCGLFHCGACGMMITGECRAKKQKNGNIHDYIYYHCIKKSKAIKHPEPCIRQEELDKQISSLLQKFSLRADWAEKLLAMTESDKEKSAQSVSAFVLESQNQIRTINKNSSDFWTAI